MRAWLRLLAVCLPLVVSVLPVQAQSLPDTMLLSTTLTADSSGIYDTLRQSALFVQVTGAVWDSLYFAEDPRFVYRWTLVAAVTGDTVFDSTANRYAPNINRLRLFPLEDGDYVLYVAKPDPLVFVEPGSLAFTVNTTPEPLRGDRWQMVSLARRVPDASMSALFGSREFWSFHWHEAPGEEAGNYVNYASRAFEQGYSCWVRPGGTADLAIDLTGSAADSSGTFLFSLREGWNQVANPFGYAVAWDSAYIRNSGGGRVKMGMSPVDENTPRGLFAWELETGSYSLREPGDDATVALMEPWQGYWLYADAAMTVYLPPTPYYALLHPGTVVAAGKGAAVPGGWRITLAARQGSAVDRCCILGTADGAADGYGPEDLYKPAPMEPAVRLDLAGGFARDIRPAGGTDEWRIDLDAADGSATELVWEGVAGIPSGCGLYLYDAGTGAVTDIKRTACYAVADGSAELRVIASDDPQFRPDALASDLRILSAGALPCAGPVDIVFTVPVGFAGTVAELTVFAGDGRTVGSEAAPAGSGRIRWDSAVDAAGVYPFVLRVGAEKVSGVLLRAE